MTIRAFALTLALAALPIMAALAQPPATPPAAPRTPAPPTAPRTPAPSTAPAAPAPPSPDALAAPRRQGQPVNVRLDVTITDQGRAGAPSLKKTVSIVTGDGMGGRIRSSANYSAIGVVPLNVDAEPELLADGKIRVRVNLQYDLPGSVAGQSAEVSGAGSLRVTQIQETLSLILDNGKPLVAAQSADPVGDRQVTIEIKATVLK
jgi:hypothetical protein